MEIAGDEQEYPQEKIEQLAMVLFVQLYIQVNDPDEIVRKAKKMLGICAFDECKYVGFLENIEGVLDEENEPYNAKPEQILEDIKIIISEFKDALVKEES